MYSAMHKVFSLLPTRYRSRYTGEWLTLFIDLKNSNFSRENIPLEYKNNYSRWHKLYTTFILLEDFNSKYDFVSLYPGKARMSHSTLVCIIFYIIRKGKTKILLL